MCDQEYDYDDDGYDDGEGYAYEDSMIGVPETGGVINAADPYGIGEARTEARTMSMREVLALQATVVDDVARLTCLSTSAATLLLNSFFWSKEVAVERYFEDPDTLLKKLSLTPAMAAHENVLNNAPPCTKLMCGICALDYEPEEMFCLSSCQHYFCMACWQDHIKAHLHQNLLSTRCPEQNCKEVIGFHNMSQLFGDDHSVAAAAAMKDIHREYLSSFVQSCPSLYWCPNPVGCTGILHVEVPPLQGQGITCDVCKQAYCLRCASAPHRPATCENMRKWRVYCSSEGANIAFILVKTKQCTKCHRDIEKNGGCNHMTCRCGHQFCWVCGEDWMKHNKDFYSCKNAAAIKTEPRTGAEKSKRFLYHYERYTLHLDSAQRDARLIDAFANDRFIIEDTERALQTEARTSEDRSYPPESILSAPELIALIKNTLVTARTLIAHAYVQMYYLDDDSNEGMMTAHRVGKLEEATEELSGKMVTYLRTSKSKFRPILDLINIVNRWQKVLCEA